MAQFIERSGDMGQRTKLSLCKDNEGDIHVSVMKIGHRFATDRIEFCNSGTKSHRTLKALHALYEAMKADEEEMADYNLVDQFKRDK